MKHTSKKIVGLVMCMVGMLFCSQVDALTLIQLAADDFEDGDYTNNPAWTVTGDGTDWSVVNDGTGNNALSRIVGASNRIYTDIPTERTAWTINFSFSLPSGPTWGRHFDFRFGVTV